MNKNTRRAILTVAAWLLLSGIVGCSKPAVKTEKSVQPVTLKIAWWGTPQRHELTSKAIQLFQQKYPHIKIEVETYPSTSTITTNLAMQTADQKLPDLIQMNYDFIGEYVGRKLLAPLDSYITQGQINLKDVDEAYLSSGRINNQLYGIPLGINALAMAYDPLLFEKTGVAVPQAGYTYDDLAKTSRDLKSKIKDKDFYPIGKANLDTGYYLRTRGGALFNKDGSRLGYDNDQYMSDFFAMQKKWMDEGLTPSTNVTTGIQNDKDSLLARGRAGLYATNSNLVLTLTQGANHPIKLLPLPQTAGGQEGNYLKPAMFFSVSAYSKNKVAAAQFIDFFTNDLAANDILMGERGVPISSKVRERLISKLSDADKEQYNYIEYVQKHSRPIDPPSPQAAIKVTALYTALLNKVLSGDLNPEEAAKQFRSGSNNALGAAKGEGQ